MRLSLSTQPHTHTYNTFQFIRIADATFYAYNFCNFDLVL